MTRRRDDLDGLRGLAIALVVISHANLFPMPLGMAGVTAFFVLSGFIITTQLLRENRIDLRNFYLRRALRLFPALLLVVGFVVLVGLIGLWPDRWPLGVVGALTYTTNALRIMVGPLGSLEHAWSLAIEEQFYLAWPLVMMAVPRRWLLGVALAGAIAGTALYLATTGSGLTPYYSTLTNGGALLAGCAVAVSRRRLPGIAGQLGIALIVVGGMMGSQLSAVIGATLVVATTTPGLIPLAAVGRRAYGIYLWNGVFYLLLPAIPAIALTVVVAEASWRFVEQPLTRRIHDGLRPGVRGSSLGNAHLPELATS